MGLPTGTAGRAGSIYNTNTNAGVAAGKNNIYAEDGTVYRYNRNTGKYATKALSGQITSTQCAVSAALACVREAGGASGRNTRADTPESRSCLESSQARGILARQPPASRISSKILSYLRSLRVTIRSAYLQTGRPVRRSPRVDSGCSDRCLF